MSNKHKHYEMIVAKAANMDLVVFIKKSNEEPWFVSILDVLVYDGYEYNFFLCLPQHKEACLHWLNGGDVESLHKDYEPMTLAESGSIEWSVKSTFMKDSIETRIKPKKEKRWIATFPWSGNVFYVTPEHFETKEMLSDYVYMYYGKQALMVSHQIEVEV